MSRNYYGQKYILDSGEIIDPLDEKSSYKYLGYIQSQQIHYSEIKNKLMQQFKSRLNSILKT
jgi:hypothetical protein